MMYITAAIWQSSQKAAVFILKTAILILSHFFRSQHSQDTS